MIRPFLLAAALLSATSLRAADADGPSRTFTGADLFGLEMASDPRIAPDGKRIAYVRRTNDIMRDRARPTIWLVDAATGAQTPLVAETDASSPRWSPDGTRIAYIASPGSGTPQLFVLWLGTGRSAQITALPGTPTSIEWSPDGTRIAYTVNIDEDAPTLGKAPKKPDGAQWAKPLETITAVTYRADGEGYLTPGFSHVFVVSADGGAPRQLTFGRFHDNGPLSWTPDGRQVLFSAVRRPDWEIESADSEVFAVDTTSAALTQLTKREGPDDEPAVSPDGRLIAYVGYDDKRLGYQNRTLYVMNRDGTNPRALTAALDRSVEQPVWARDSRALYVSYEDRAEKKVARVGLDGRITTVATGLAGGQLDRPYTGGDFSVARDGTVALTTAGPLRPADLGVARGGRAVRLTRLNEDLLAAKALAEPVKLPVTAPDGRAVDAWLMLPPGAAPDAKLPLILEIHGGPFAAYGPYFSTDDQLYAAAGYAVLYVNPRGSTSYGAEFANLIHHKYPGDDYADLMAAVDAAIAAGRVDPNNLFVTGGSGGGALTAWIVGKTTRFKAAATQKPVIDWASFALTADNPSFFARYWFGAMPWEDPQAYWARSPLSLVGNVKTPTLVVVGSEDYRTPVSEAEQYYSALKLRGVDTAFVKVPGASHGGIAARPSQSAAKASAILAWFDKYRGR
ncbi:alpha/beta hydrolase family protein [Sphingomonas jatrophae]|nr:S9 family peptidase [Sphingomonas jatrophae]